MVCSVTDAVLQYSHQNCQHPLKASMQKFTRNGFRCDAVPSQMLGFFPLFWGSFIVPQGGISGFEVNNSSSSRVAGKRAGRFCKTSIP